MIEMFFDVAYMDIIIAGILIVVGFGVFIASRIGALPKKTLPFIVAGLVGAISVTVMQAIFKKRILKELDERKAELDQRKTELEKRQADLEKRHAHLETERSGLQKRLDETNVQDARLAEIEAARDKAWAKVKAVMHQLERQKIKYLETMAAIDKRSEEEVEKIRKAHEEMSTGELVDTVFDN